MHRPYPLSQRSDSQFATHGLTARDTECRRAIGPDIALKALSSSPLRHSSQSKRSPPALPLAVYAPLSLGHTFWGFSAGFDGLVKATLIMTSPSAQRNVPITSLAQSPRLGPCCPAARGLLCNVV